MTRRIFDWHPELNLFAKNVRGRTNIRFFDYEKQEMRDPRPDEVGFVDVDDVAQYIYDHGIDGAISTEKLCIRSPWQLAWMEYDLPDVEVKDETLLGIMPALLKSIAGELHIGAYVIVSGVNEDSYHSALSSDMGMRLLSVMDTSIDPQVSIPVWKKFAEAQGRDRVMANRARQYECHAIQVMQVFITDRKDWSSTGYVILYLDEHGRRIPDTEAAVVDFGGEAVQRIAVEPFMMALGLLNCRNVETKVVPYSGHQQKKLKRSGSPLITRRTLVIKPQGKRYEGSGESTGRENRWHMCRGHFKTFTEAAPLFGRVTGTFWWQAQVRGSKSRGEVHKDYLIDPE